ncbi:DUF2271 domain-containing protein [Pseudoalteromonas denitrificans]|uniref:DUF2271 domain-containing protein n=1 Tax=Pseudoalteromonas denitrificans DSM 6059 TaxID=1123010 RepID=A0A1I1PSE7_9GAMM|nr:DUF2271 domain-containing protein [Pseudoalteromonas denitrificans]SFD12617.1 Hypothetical protein SAMN02745724_03572 [Pseudoalteromonas denitrificans DSM 6059]
MKKSTSIACSLLFCSALPVFAQSNLSVSLTLPEIKTGQYHRPYTAVWIENNKGQHVKTLALWTEPEGQKWLKDIRRWWRKIGRSDKQLVDGISSATRPAGTYSLNWDLTDEKNNPVKKGDYKVFFEVVREHGGRNLLKHSFKLNGTSFEEKLAETQETGPIKIKLN